MKLLDLWGTNEPWPMQRKQTSWGKLRQERSSLEKRIETCTAELQSEVKERMRVEQLNRGRNQVLEMLARDEPTEEIFRVLVEVLARHRSTWACALHILEDGTLHLKASADVPEKLIRNLQQLSAGMAGVPELEALSQSKALILGDLAADRKPWTELLRANGIQSLWSAPFWTGQEPARNTHDLYAAAISSVAGGSGAFGDTQPDGRDGARTLPSAGGTSPSCLS